MAWHRSNETSKRLDELPGVGPALATALVASVADPKAFRSGRNFSAWIGLVPQQHPSGGKDKLGSISKQGDRYLRSLFTAGALAVIRYAKMYAKEGEEPEMIHTCFVAAIDVAETREPYAIWGGVRAGSDFFRREIWTWPR